MAAPQQGTGYVNLSRYLDANQDALNKEAGTLANNDAQAAQIAQSQANGAKAGGKAPEGSVAGPQGVADFTRGQAASQDAYSNLQGLTNPGSLKDQVQKAYQGGGENVGFDSDLLGSSAGAQGTFKTAQTGFAGLNGYLDGQAASMGAGGPAQGTGSAPKKPPQDGEPVPGQRPAGGAPGVRPRGGYNF